MAIGSSYARDLAKKAPPPDAMEALGIGDDDEAMEMEGPAEDEDADAAVAQSAFDDFARAAGIKAGPGAYAALKEMIHACMKAK